MNKNIEIIGPSGSGKSFLANKLVEYSSSFFVIDSDKIWEKGDYGDSFRKKRIRYIEKKISENKENKVSLLPEFFLIRPEVRKEISCVMENNSIENFSIVINPSWEVVERYLKMRKEKYPSYDINKGRELFELFQRNISNIDFLPQKKIEISKEYSIQEIIEEIEDKFKISV